MTYKSNSWPLVFFALLLPLVSVGQNSGLGNWVNYFGNKKLDNKWNWHHEVQYRNYDAIGDLEQLLIRTGLGRDLTENNNNLLLGYGYILSQNYNDTGDTKVDVHEHRIFQQFITRQKAGVVNLQHRYRFEQRFIAGDFKARMRYFLGITIPIAGKEMVSKSFYLSLYNEIFIDTDQNPFDRNRLYGGLGYILNGKVRFELGYMNQFFSIGNRDQLNMNTFVTF